MRKIDYLHKPMLPEGTPVRAIYLEHYVRKAEHLDYHPHYEMYFCPKPIPQIVTVNGEQRSICVPNVVIHSPYTVHVMMPEDPLETEFERYVFYFSEGFFQWFSAALFPREWFLPGANTVLFPDAGSCRILSDILKNAYREGVTAQEQGCCFSMFLLMLNRTVPPDKRESFRHTKNEIPALLQFIHQNIGGDLSEECITREFGISRAKLNRDLHATVGRSLHRIVIDCRLSAAARMLRETTTPVREIAGSCGFENEYYFYSFFKTKTGRTPLQYRNQKAEEKPS